MAGEPPETAATLQFHRDASALEDGAEGFPLQGWLYKQVEPLGDGEPVREWVEMRRTRYVHPGGFYDD